MIKFLRATVMGTLLFCGVAHAEQLCFRTSDCSIGETCRGVQGSAMGLCTEIRNEQAERRAQDTENFNPWVQGGGIDAYQSDESDE